MSPRRRACPTAAPARRAARPTGRPPGWRASPPARTRRARGGPRGQTGAVRGAFAPAPPPPPCRGERALEIGDFFAGTDVRGEAEPPPGAPVDGTVGRDRRFGPAGEHEAPAGRQLDGAREGHPSLRRGGIPVQQHQRRRPLPPEDDRRQGGGARSFRTMRDAAADRRSGHRQPDRHRHHPPLDRPAGAARSTGAFRILRAFRAGCQPRRCSSVPSLPGRSWVRRPRRARPCRRGTVEFAGRIALSGARARRDTNQHLTAGRPGELPAVDCLDNAVLGARHAQASTFPGRR